MAAVRRDFFLDPRARLSEQERALMTAMLHDLVASLATAIRAAAGAVVARTDPDAMVATLASANLLDRPQVVRLMLRRADEHRIMTAFTGQAGPRRLPLLPRLVSDTDPGVAATAMALVVARGRRRDGFGQPRIEFSDLDRADARALAYAVAAMLSPDPTADARFASAAAATVDSIDHDHKLDRAVQNLVDGLDRTGRADDALVESASAEGEVALVAMLIARRAGIDQPSVWDHLIDAGEGGIALLARMAGLARPVAARLIADFGSTTGRWSVEEEIGRFDALSAATVESSLRQWQLPSDYRAAVRGIGGRHG